MQVRKQQLELDMEKQTGSNSLRAKEAQREPWGSRGQPPSKALGRPLWARGGGETAVGDAEGGELMSITHVAFSPYLKQTPTGAAARGNP